MTNQDDRQAIADLVRRERFHRESIHLIAPAEIRVNGDRVLCESNAQIVNRSVLHDVEGGRPDPREPFYAAAERWLAGEA
jgi:hypothetical protein